MAARIAEVLKRMKSPLVRKADAAPVIRADGGADLMRWGFSREFNPAINNARGDKLEGGMWGEAFRQRRCVIPMTLFYEWGPGTGGRKQTNQFDDPEDDFLWVAGIWEAHPELGPCYSMVTTAASPLMSPIHDRMPALLRTEEMDEWMAGAGTWDFQPFSGPLVVTPCESPLGKGAGTGKIQGELF